MALRYRAVMFDLGGTLFLDLPSHIGIANQRAALRILGLDDYSDAQLAGAFVPARRHTEVRMRDAGFYQHGTLVREHFKAGVQTLAGNHEIESDRLDRAADAYADAQKRSVLNWLRPRPDCHSTLRELRQLGCDLSIVSNNDDEYLQGLVYKWHLAGYLRCWMSSDAVQVCKPAAEIFHIALQRTGLSPVDVLYVGDTPDDDVVGAHAAGMDVALLASASAQIDTAHDADHRIETLSELIDIVVT